MNKKFLSALLCGATLLASTSTFVSCKDYDDDINSLENKVAIEISAREALAQKVAAAESAISDLQAAKTAIEAELAKKENSADHAKDVQALEEKIAANKGDITALQQELKKLTDKHVADIAELNGKIALIDEAIKDLKKVAETHATKVELASEVATLNTKIDADIAAAKAELNAAIALKADQTALDKTNENLAKTDTKLTQVANDLNDLTTKVNTLNDKLYGTAGDIARLDAAIKAQEAALKSAKEQLEKAIKEGDEATLKSAKEYADSLKAVIDKDVKDLKAEVEKADSLLQVAIDDLAKEVAKKANKADVDKTIDDLKKDIAATYATKDELKNAVDGLQEQIDDINTKKIPAVESKIAAINNYLPVMSKILSNKLRSMVFIPELYVDGIEAIQYPVLLDKSIIKTTAYLYSLPKEVHGVANDEAIAGLTDYNHKGGGEQVVVGPAWPVNYHINPSTANINLNGDIKGYNVRAVQSITRVAVDELGAVTSPAKYTGGAQLAKVENGVLTTGIQVEKPLELFFNGPDAIKEGATGNISADKDAATIPDTKFMGIKMEYKVNDALASFQADGGTKNHLDNIVALQVKAAADTLVTSDYAMLHATAVTLEGIVWTGDIKNKKASAATYTDNDNYTYDGTNSVEYDCKTQVHVYDTPQEALEMSCKEKNYVELPWNGEGITLANYLGVHFYSQNVTRTGWSGVKTWKFVNNPSSMSVYDDLANYGITYEFETLDYTIGGNTTSDSHYAQLTDGTKENKKASDTYYEQSPKGIIKAGNVDNKGVFTDVQSITSVGREPLVRVLVKQGANVLLDGYILVRIVKEATPDKVAETGFTAPDKTFDLCNGGTYELMNWSQFSADILTKLLDNMDPADFNKFYGPGATNKLAGSADGYWDAAAHKGGNSYEFECFEYSEAKDDKQDQARLGKIIFCHDEKSANNQRIVWSFTAEELEKITHDIDKMGTYSTYIKWTRCDNAAPYKYIWVKLTVNIKRRDVAVYSFAEKIDNYWFDKNTGDQAGNTAIVLNCNSPKNGQNTISWIDEISSRLVGNNLFLTKDNALIVEKCDGVDANISTQHKNITSAALKYVTNAPSKTHIANGAKYYFTPETTTYTALNGKKYTVTPFNGANANYNKMQCVYLGEWHEWVSEENMNKVINSCVIKYNEGVFTNNKLYAVEENTTDYQLIATLDQQTGDITLVHPTVAPGDPAKINVFHVLNAVGYQDNKHSNINKELRQMVGVIALERGVCEHAAQMKESTFLASWQRPINLEEIEEKYVLDAKSNANYIYLADAISFFDWRGPYNAAGATEDKKIQGDMNLPTTKWLWAFYGINKITVDCTPSKVYTNMHGADITKTTMDKISSKAKLYANDAHAAKYTYNFDLSAYNSSLNSAALYNKFHEDAFKKTIGYIYYDNNGDNVNEFQVKVPITIGYDWGEFTEYVTITVDNTLGNHGVAKRR